MAEQADGVQVENDETQQADENYKPPAEVSLNELREKDAEDESLARYKQQLLGEAVAGDPIIFPNDPRKVILQTMTLIAAERPDQELDLTQDKNVLKQTHLKIKEGTEYRIKISFYVQREIVAGLKYVQKTAKAGVNVDKTTTMIGSFGPENKLKEATTKPEEAPKGMIVRGSYKVSSCFMDDDKNKYLEWEWSLDIVKDYKD